MRGIKTTATARRKTRTSDKGKGERNIIKAVEIRTILVPVDFSKPAEQAMNYALRLARIFGSQIRLLHVIEASTVVTDSMTWVDFYSQVKAVTQPMLENLAKTIRQAGVQVKADLVRGTAYAEIVKQARRHRVDLIVIGTHGRTGLQHLMMGSVAERVVRMAPCPVLSIHPS